MFGKNKFLVYYCLVSLLVFCVIVPLIKGFLSFHNNPIKQYTENESVICKTYLSGQRNPYLLPLNRDCYKDKITNIIDITPYTIYHKNLDFLFTDGFCVNLMNIIFIDDDLNHTSYARVLMHELIHCKYNTPDERYVNFTTFVLLYESEDPYLHEVGLIMGCEQLNQTKRDFYWCKDLVIDYLLKEMNVSLQ